MNSRERVFTMIDGGEVDYLPLMPITMMFAGDRSGVKYGEYARDYRVLVEAQLKVAEDFGFDQVATVSDPAREAADCGAKVEFYENQPPAIVESEALLADKTALAKLQIPDPLGGGRMHDRVKAVELFKQKVGNDKIIEGWVEGPCAMAADLRGINHFMLDLIDDEAFVRDIFEFAVDMELRFAKAQVEAGVDVMGVGDAAASLVGPELYKEFVLPYEMKLVKGLRSMGTKVRMHICGNIGDLLESMSELGCDIVDIDYLVPISKAREKIGPGPVLLGNLDPVSTIRNGTHDGVYAAVEQCHQEAGSRFIVGAGCEIPRDTAPENLHALTEYARSH